MPVRNLFSNYFNGQPGKKDYTEADLPANRFQLFRVVLQVRRGSMVGLNLLYLLCWIPAVVWTFLNLIQLQQMPAQDVMLQGEYINRLLLTYLLVLFPLTALTGPFSMGLAYVMRNWARDEHAYPFGDFISAMKQNWKQGLLFSTIGAAVPVLVYISFSFYLGMVNTSALFYLPLAVVLLVAAVWYLSATILPTMIVTYRQSFPALLRNAVLMTFASLPRCIAIKLATLAVPLLVLAGAMLFPAALSWISAAAVVLYATILPAFNKLICASHANALCETYLNPKIAGARTGIGLRPKNATGGKNERKPI